MFRVSRLGLRAKHLPLRQQSKMARTGVVWITVLIAGFIALAGGIFALFNPLAATITAIPLTAWLFIIVGVIEIFSVFSAPGWAPILGGLTIILGVWMLSNPLPSVLALTWLIWIVFPATGATKVILATRVRGSGYFWVILLSGVISIVLGVMVLANFPYSAATILGVLLAVELISTGTANIALALHLRETGPTTA